MKAALAIAAVLLAGMGALVLSGRDAGDRVSAVTTPAWDEVPWPFPIDQWGKGKALVCKAGACGTEVTLYIRAKIGFCNCATGVADDEELDRISDFALLGTRRSEERRVGKEC